MFVYIFLNIIEIIDAENSYYGDKARYDGDITRGAGAPCQLGMHGPYAHAMHT